MTRLPLLVSVPHAGLTTPPEVTDLNLLSRDQVVKDGDEQAAEVYDLESFVEHSLRADVARAFVDINRAPHDRRKDGVVKTHTCWDEIIYKEALSEDLVQVLLARYHAPYHLALTRLAGKARLAVDCHTMAAEGPPVGPDPGVVRPHVCLSNADDTCPESWIESLAESFRRFMGDSVKVNDPFKGGYIIRRHSSEMPWVQLEISRGSFLSADEKRTRVLQALDHWVQGMNF